MGIKLPHLDGARLGRSFILRQARRRVEQVMAGIGEDRLRWLVQNNRHLREFLTPEQEEEFRRKGAALSWLRGAITREALLAMVPPWATAIVDAAGEPGRQWLAEELDWLGGFLVEKEVDA